jgi:hypothetical protein
MNLFKGDGRSWLFEVFPGSNLRMYFPDAEVPNRFHRFLQRWLLGFRWTRQP